MTTTRRTICRSIGVTSEVNEGATFELFLPLVLLATLALLVEGWLANPIRARAEKTKRPESTQAANQDKHPDDALSTSGQEVLVSRGAG